MTKRKILAVIIALAICAVLSACSAEKSEGGEQSKFGLLIVIEEGNIENTNLYQYIMYDPDTMVMYSYLDGSYGGGPTEMYNADGTLKLYSPEN